MRRPNGTLVLPGFTGANLFLLIRLEEQRPRELAEIEVNVGGSGFIAELRKARVSYSSAASRFNEKVTVRRPSPPRSGL